MDKKSVKTIFFGTPEFAVPALKALIEGGYNVVAVVTQPEKPNGRKNQTSPSPIKKFAKENNLPVLEPSALKDSAFSEAFKNFNLDLCIVAAYGRIIPKQYMDLPRYGFINIHPSHLPQYRGPSPVQTAILDGQEQTGTSIMLIDDQVDHGPILNYKNYAIPDTYYYEEAKNDLAQISAGLLIDTLNDYLEGKITPQPQKHEEATYTKILERQDGKIDWNKSARDVYNQIRALNPEPGTWTTWNGKILNIKKASVLELEAMEQPGQIKKIDKNIVIATKKCYLLLQIIQLEGKRETDAQAFLNGHSDFIDSTLE